MSCLQALYHLKIDHPIIAQILAKLNSLTASDFDIHLCWLPGPVGIPGNERADRAAKRARRTLQAFMRSLWLLEALTCSRREDGLSGQGVKPPLARSLAHSLTALG